MVCYWTTKTGKHLFYSCQRYYSMNKRSSCIISRSLSIPSKQEQEQIHRDGLCCCFIVLCTRKSSNHFGASCIKYIFNKQEQILSKLQTFEYLTGKRHFSLFLLKKILILVIIIIIMCSESRRSFKVS